ncbi:co-chaperone HscB [Pseudidiomarina terrestris]|uniref:Co-chaperone protein HscB homolog n=1 Tax=Pseudidiomarina terrestris TaxID=2820060 RepID=A0ABT8MH64_9GAMM|nr:MULTISPECIES: co-chaperone HscB [unclassified Pseudidiomarina]MDN7127017.1 co-chaperone HscB [Pseudidiomarina sp. 1APR75-33.1]MDN7129282.1 co-chaperone HscB [Pseudidiomarina sp. 1APR75-15]MDN7134452.1 co-chaperone HscB [Pseudidiomarina sp. 1ASP75-5]MDN7136859.1 co-chaperone HscB [Pseudidiomarina sp. 1ASP75-14]MEA3587753.1 co-chaperone HscB [Pseudidiomarina sp. 1APP75-27a]
MNHFELFDITPVYALDLADLQLRYRKLQQAMHPDRFANASERDKLLAVQRTSQLNDAYHTLRDPLLRAEYIVSLRGVDMQHEQKTLQDPEFLMAQMAWRERVEELNVGDFAAIDEAFADLERETKLLQNTLEQQIEANANEEAADTIRKLKFMQKLGRELEALEDE